MLWVIKTCSAWVFLYCMSTLVLGQRHTCLKPTESGKNWNPQAQALQEFHSRWRLNLVPACFSKETGKTSQEMLGRPRKDDWFQDTHNGCSILWAPVAWISKHFLDFDYNSCKILKKKKKMDRSKCFCDVIQRSRKEIFGVVV